MLSFFLFAFSRVETSPCPVQMLLRKDSEAHSVPL